MKRFVEGVARDQGGLFPMHLDDFVGEDNPVRVVDAFVDMLDLRDLGFASVDPRTTGRPNEVVSNSHGQLQNADKITETYQPPHDPPFIP